MLGDERDVRRALRNGEVTVDEVEIRPVRDLLERAREGSPLSGGAIPAHVGNLQAGMLAEAPHPAREDPQTLTRRIFLAALEQDL